MIQHDQTLVEIGQLQRAKYNPRIISAAEMSKLKKSLREFGFVQPLIARAGDMLLIGGHQRLTAYQEILAEDGTPPFEIDFARVPVVLLDISDAKAMALNLALNKISGEWDYEKLGEVFETLKGDEAMSFAAFDSDEVDRVIQGISVSVDVSGPEASTTTTKPKDVIHAVTVDEGNVPPAQLTRAQELQAKWGTARGQLWSTGRHRILCGDATRRDDVILVTEAIRRGECVDMVWTDPPYGVAVVGGDRRIRPEDRGGQVIEGDSMSEDDLTDFLGCAFAAALDVCKCGASWYVAAPSGRMFLPFLQQLNGMGITRQFIVWHKQHMVPGFADYAYDHEMIVYGWKPGAPGFGVEDRTQTSVWQIKRPSAAKEHPSMKPVELVARAIRNSTHAGDSVLDPFCGSGTTILAAHETDRVGYGIEQDPGYFAVILQRLADLGLEPKLEFTRPVSAEEADTLVASKAKEEAASVKRAARASKAAK